MMTSVGERSSDTCLEQEAAHPQADPGANGSYARPCLVLFFQSLLLLICCLAIFAYPIPSGPPCVRLYAGNTSESPSQRLMVHASYMQ